MTSSVNPWLDVLSQPQQKTTDGIIPYFNKQTKMLSEASGGKVKGLFSRTFDVNRTLVPALDLAESASQQFQELSQEELSFLPPIPFSKMPVTCTRKMTIASRFVLMVTDSDYSPSNLIRRILPS